MNSRTLMLVLFALLAAGGSAYLAKSWVVAQRSGAPAAVEKSAAPAAMVLVAKTKLPTGTFVKNEHLTWQSWPDDNLSDAYLVKEKNTMEELNGAVARAPIAIGQPVTSALVVKPGDRGFLAAVLKPGMRAAAINVNAASGLAGLILPGDHVDIILTQALGGDADTQRRASETIMQDIRVLALDQRVATEGAADVPKTATLEVSQKQAEALTVASELGRLSLSLRALAMEGGEDMAAASETSNKPTWDRDVSESFQMMRGGGGASSGGGVSVVRGGGSKAVSSAGGARSAGASTSTAATATATK